MTRKQKKTLYRILTAFVLFVAALLVPTIPHYPLLTLELFGGKPIVLGNLLLFLIPYLVIGWDVLWKAVRNIMHGQVFDENFLMCVATIGALIIGEFPEAVAVMLFYQVGELFQRDRKSVV